MRNGRPGTHIPEYHPHPSHCRNARGPGLRTGRCPPRGTSPYKELVSPEVPGLYGGQNHGCSSKLQNSVKQVFLCEQREGSSSAQDPPPCREGGRSQCPGVSRSAFREPIYKVPPSGWPSFCPLPLQKEHTHTPTVHHSALSSKHLCKPRLLQAAGAIFASRAT